MEPNVSMSSSTDSTIVYPAAFTFNNRVLFMVTSSRIEERTESLLILFNEYQAMCESGFNPKIVLFTFSAPRSSVQKYLQSKTYCYRIKQYLPFEYFVSNSSVKYHLPDATRPYMASVLNDFDVFIYTEDDMIIKNSHLIGYIDETKELESKIQLDSQLSQDSKKWKKEHHKVSGYHEGDYIIGFHRISQTRKDKKGQRTVWEDYKIIEYDRLVEQPSYQPICIGDTPYILSPSHQAVWILLKHQVLYLQSKCHFLQQKSSENLPREYMSSFSLFNRPGDGGCDLTKVFPVETYLNFNVLHYFDGYNEVSTKIKAAAFDTYNNLTHGILLKEGDVYPTCWNSIIERNKNASLSHKIDKYHLRSNVNSTASSMVNNSVPVTLAVQSSVSPNITTSAVMLKDIKQIHQSNGYNLAEGIEVTEFICMILVFTLASIYRYRHNIRRFFVGSDIV